MSQITAAEEDESVAEQLAAPTLLCKNFRQRVEMEETMLHEAPFCLLFTAAHLLMILSQFSAFDGAMMSSVTKNLFDTYRVEDIDYLRDATHVVETLEVC